MIIIETLKDVRLGCDWLARKEPVFARVLETTGVPPLRRRAPGFSGLARIVTAQQLSGASAKAIWRRLDEGVLPFEADVFLTMADETLRQFGLSAGKIKTLRGVARALARGEFSLDGLARAPDDAVRGKLTALAGIGPWTAEIYLLTCLGRADVWPAGDLALQKAVASAFCLDERPGVAHMERLSAAWRPWRSVAARLLWAYYTGGLGRDGRIM